jgi:hypothetical protein
VSFSELSDMRMEQVRDARGEERSARRYATGWCPSGQHVLARDGRGGQCECGFGVSVEEL